MTYSGKRPIGASRRKFLTAAGGAVGISVATAGCTDFGDDTITWQANSPAAEGSVHGDAAAWIGEIVEEETDGEMEIDAFRNSELGGQIESTENVSTGGLDMYVIPYALTGTQYAPAQVFDAPYMYDPDEPYEHIHEVTDPLESDVASDVAEELIEETDIRPIGSVVQGTRRVTITGDPVYSPDGLGSKELRAVPIPIYEETTVGLGAETTEIDFEEVPQALQTGEVDGQENPYNVIISSGIHEHTDYVLETDHMHTPLAIIVNEDNWQDLDETFQDVLYDATEEIRSDALDLIEENIEEHRASVRDEGAEIIEPDELEMDEFRTEVRQHIRDVFEDDDDVGDNFIDRIEEIAYEDYQ